MAYEHLRNLQHLFEDWRSLQAGKFEMVQYHECTRHCRLVSMRVFVCPVTGICFNGPANEFPFVVFDVSTQQREWVNGHGPCAHRSHDVNGLVSSRDIWCCHDTGWVHFCGIVCNKKKVTHEGYEVCELTGTILRTLILEEKPEIPVGAVREKTVELTTEQVRGNAVNVDLSKVLDRLGNRSKRTRECRHVMEFIHAASLAFVTQYVEERHNKTIPDRIEAQNRNVHGALKNVYEKRKIAAAQRNSRVSPNIDCLQLFLMAMYLRQKQTSTMRAQIPQATRTERAQICAIQIVALMAVMRLYVPGGREFVDKFSTHDFFTIGLEVCRRGLAIRDITDRYDVVLLSRDPLIVSLAEGRSDAAKFLHDKTTRNSVRIKHTAEEAPSAISRLFQDAVWTHHINPEQLRIDEISMSLQHIPAEAFEEYKL